MSYDLHETWRTIAPLNKTTKESCSLETKWKEMRSDSGLLHSTLHPNYPRATIKPSQICSPSPSICIIHE